MPEEITVRLNDTWRRIEVILDNIEEWRTLYPLSRHDRPTSLVVTKLEEAQHWALHMVNYHES